MTTVAAVGVHSNQCLIQTNRVIAGFFKSKEPEKFSYASEVQADSRIAFYKNVENKIAFEVIMELRTTGMNASLEHQKWFMNKLEAWLAQANLISKNQITISKVKEMIIAQLDTNEKEKWIKIVTTPKNPSTLSPSPKPSSSPTNDTTPIPPTTVLTDGCKEFATDVIEKMAEIKEYTETYATDGTAMVKLSKNPAKLQLDTLDYLGRNMVRSSKYLIRLQTDLTDAATTILNESQPKKKASSRDSRKFVQGKDFIY